VLAGTMQCGSSKFNDTDVDDVEVVVVCARGLIGPCGTSASKPWGSHCFLSSHVASGLMHCISRNP
jgi:hypothetical protein